MPTFILYHHHRRGQAREGWEHVGTYESLRTAQAAASEHASGPMIEAQAWIMDKQDGTWRLVANGEAYKVERVLHPHLDQTP